MTNALALPAQDLLFRRNGIHETADNVGLFEFD